MTHCWETSVKNDRMSASSMKFTFLLLIPTMSASSVRAGCVSVGTHTRNRGNLPRGSRSAPQPWLSGRFVFEGHNRERTLAAVFLRNVAPTGR